MSKKILMCVMVAALVLLALPVFAEDKIPVAFTFKPPIPATSVNVAGTFNGWSATANPMSDPEGDGIWAAVIELAPGSYQYKFVVNGDKWYEDPYAADFVSDGYGGKNSIVYVGVAKPAAAAASGLKFDGWLESKIERVGDATPNNYNDVYLKFSGTMRPGLETFTEIHGWKTLNLGSLGGWNSLLPLPVDGMEVNQAVFTLSLADGLSAKLHYKGHAGNTMDHLVFIKSDDEEDRIWNRKAVELVYSKASVDGRIGVASLADDNTTMVYGDVQGEVSPGLTLGGLFSYETWPTDQRDDGEDHRTNLGAYVTARIDDYTTVRGEVIQTRGTKMVSDSTVPVEVEFVYPKERESSGATTVYVVGEFQGWDTNRGIPMNKDADGYWRATIELLEGEYEYKFWYPDPEGNPSWGHWMGTGDGGDNLVRHVGGSEASLQDFYFTEPVEDQVYIRGSWDWDHGAPVDYPLVKDAVTGGWKYTRLLDPGRYEYIFHYNDGTSEHWCAQGGSNITIVAGAGGREADYTALAYLAEFEYARDPLGAKVGVKGAQAGFDAPRGLVGTDYRTIYADTWYKIADNTKLLLYTAYSTNGAGESDTATTTVKPGFDITAPAPGVEYVKGHYEINRGKNEVDTGYLETKYKALKLCVEYKNNDPDADSVKITATNDFPLEFWGKAEYSKVLEGGSDNLYVEVTKKLAFCDETKVGVSYNTSDRKLVLKLTVDF
ncbi:MAG: hypothetical protein ACM309_11570 [Bacillota bacterium]